MSVGYVVCVSRKGQIPYQHVHFPKACGCIGNDVAYSSNNPRIVTGKSLAPAQPMGVVGGD